MTFEGFVQNGAIVLEKGTTLPEGTRVKVSVDDADQDGKSLREFLLKHVGAAKGLPTNLAEQHDHYLHGTPKQ